MHDSENVRDYVCTIYILRYTFSCLHFYTTTPPYIRLPKDNVRLLRLLPQALLAIGFEHMFL